MSPRVCVASVVTLYWTCVLFRPIVARVIKIFEPMNIRRSNDRGCALLPFAGEDKGCPLFSLFLSFSPTTFLSLLLSCYSLQLLYLAK